MNSKQLPCNRIQTHLGRPSIFVSLILPRPVNAGSKQESRPAKDAQPRFILSEAQHVEQKLNM